MSDSTLMLESIAMKSSLVNGALVVTADAVCISRRYALKKFMVKSRPLVQGHTQRKLGTQSFRSNETAFVQVSTIAGLPDGTSGGLSKSGDSHHAQGFHLYWK